MKSSVEIVCWMAGGKLANVCGLFEVREYAGV